MMKTGKSNKNSTTNFKNAIAVSKEGVLLGLHVIPKSDKTCFPVKYDKWRKSMEIKVNCEARENKANDELIACLASFFSMNEKGIIIVYGRKSRDKTVLLRKKNMNEINAKIVGALSEL